MTFSVLGPVEAFEAGLALGREHDLVIELEAAVIRHPLRERLWGQLMLALYRSGRQADALAAYQRARRHLGEELGIEPGRALRDLETAVLRQDPALDRAPAPARPTTAAAPPRPPEDATIKAAGGKVATLVLPDGSERLLGDGPLVVGRGADCDIVLPDPAVSRRHAEIRPALGGHLLVDTGSTNGTTVNGSAVLHHLLADGDLIGIGDLALTYRRPA